MRFLRFFSVLEFRIHNARIPGKIRTICGATGPLQPITTDPAAQTPNPHFSPVIALNRGREAVHQPQGEAHNLREAAPLFAAKRRQVVAGG